MTVLCSDRSLGAHAHLRGWRPWGHSEGEGQSSSSGSWRSEAPCGFLHQENRVCLEEGNQAAASQSLWNGSPSEEAHLFPPHSDDQLMSIGQRKGATSWPHSSSWPIQAVQGMSHTWICSFSTILSASSHPQPLLAFRNEQTPLSHGKMTLPLLIS